MQQCIVGLQKMQPKDNFTKRLHVRPIILLLVLGNLKNKTKPKE